MSERFQSRSPVSYIVRVYRRKRLSQQIAGVVENPDREERSAFASFDELKAILLRASGKVARISRAKKNKRT